MPVSRDIASMYRRPRAIVRGLLDMGVREDRAIAWLMIGCFLLFLARLPALQRNAVLRGSDFQQDAIYSFFALMMIAPLLFYGLAFLIWLVTKIMRPSITAFSVRLVVFWGWLSAAPLALFYGLLVGFNGAEHPGSIAIGVIWLIVLLLFWISGLIEASKDGK